MDTNVMAHSSFLMIFALCALLHESVAYSDCDDVNFNSGGRYHVTHHNNSCYLFVLKRVSIKTGFHVCRNFGGFLADVSESTRQFFKSYVLNFNETAYGMSLLRGYMVGYIYSEAFGSWYWDSGFTGNMPSLVNERWFTSYYCAKIEGPDYHLQSYSCGSEQHPFICKLDPRHTSSVKSGGNQTECSVVCKDVNQRLSNMLRTMTISTPQTSTTSTASSIGPSYNVTSNSTLFKTTTQAPDDTTTHSQDGDKQNVIDSTGQDAICDDEDDNEQTSILLAVLGLSMAANIGLTILIVYLKCCSGGLSFKVKTSEVHSDAMEMQEFNGSIQGKSDSSQLKDTGTSNSHQETPIPESDTSRYTEQPGVYNNEHSPQTYYTLLENGDTGRINNNPNDGVSKENPKNEESNSTNPAVVAKDDDVLYQNQEDLGVKLSETGPVVEKRDGEITEYEIMSPPGSPQGPSEKVPHDYSVLGEHMKEPTTTDNVYGMESASKPFSQR